ncbi:hypothetical protein D3C77_369240 [compost metagenome]
MHMQNIKILLLRYLRHLRGQGQIIGRIPEHIIITYFHFVIKNILVITSQAKRNTVRNKVNLMPFLCQQLAKFGCHNPGTAKCRIAGYADF